MPSRDAGNVVRFPPLPTRPEAPRFPPDERQGRFERIAGRLGEQIGDEMELKAANTARGFPASAVDLGRLKEALESALGGFDMTLIRERWDADLSAWMAATVMEWVQRCKTFRFDRRAEGIHVEVETQDDHGYYHYAFDIFPGRK